jgi:hypothetical protein
MDVDEVSFFLMEMDTISRFHVIGHIASGYFFHVFILREIPSLAIDNHCHIRVMMHLIGSGSEYIGSDDTRDEDEEKEEEFHRGGEVIRSYSTACIITSRQPRVAQIVRMRRVS